MATITTGHSRHHPSFDISCIARNHTATMPRLSAMSPDPLSFDVPVTLAKRTTSSPTKGFSPTKSLARYQSRGTGESADRRSSLETSFTKHEITASFLMDQAANPLLVSKRQFGMMPRAI